MRADDFLDDVPSHPKLTADAFLDGPEMPTIGAAKLLPQPAPELSIKDRIYEAANKLFGRGGSVMDGYAGPVPAYDPTASLALQEQIANGPQSVVRALPDAPRQVSGIGGVLEKGARGGVGSLGKAGAGMVQAAADAVGADSLSGFAAGAANQARKFQGGVQLDQTPIAGFAPDSIVNDLPDASASAISSIIANLPAIAANVVAPGSGLPMMGVQSTAGEYSDGRAEGLGPGGAALRAIPMAAAEVLGEKVGGFHGVTSGLRRSIDEGSVVPLAREMVKSGVKEVPGEELTTTLQFGIDKAPGVGLKQEATFQDYLRAAKDTALATVLQSGGMVGAGAALGGMSQPAATATQTVDPTLTPAKQEAAAPSAEAFLDAPDQADMRAETEPAIDMEALRKDAEAMRGRPVTEQDTIGRAESAPQPAPTEPVEAPQNAPQNILENIPQVAQPEIATNEQIASQPLDAAVAPAGNPVVDVASTVPAAEPKYQVPAQLTERATQLEQATEGLRPGDIVAASGSPFKTKSQATKEARAAGTGWQVKKGAGGFVVRYQPQTDAQVANTQRLLSAQNNVDQERDSMFGAIAKLGGVRIDDLTKQWGFDPAEFKNLRVGIKPVARQNGGMSLDRVGEALAELGYLSYDESGKHDLAELFDLFDGELRGNKHYTPQGYENSARVHQYQEWLGAQEAQASGLNDLPEEAHQNEIEEYLNEYETISAEESAQIGSGDPAADAGPSVGGQNGEVPGGAAEGGDGGIVKADRQASRAPDPGKPSGQPDQGAAAVDERRQDTVTRKTVSEMTPEEMQRALMTDDLTGLGNRRAYVESAKKPHQASIDIDSLKWVNDSMGHESGDQLLAMFGQALADETQDGYHLSGDEFAAQFDSAQEGRDLLERVRERLAGAELRAMTADGSIITKRGVEFSYGIDKTLRAADEQLLADKARREQSGQRAGRGREPAGVSTTPAQGNPNSRLDAPTESTPQVTRGINPDAVKAAIAADTFNHSVDVYATLNDAPDHIQLQAKSEGVTGVEGFWDPRSNRIALIAENLSSAERAVEVARHELIGHYGMENMVGKKEMDRLADRVILAELDGNKTIVDIAKYVDETQPNLPDQRRAREIIAVMAERNVQNSVAKRVMDAIRKFLKSIGFAKKDITDAEIAGLLRDAQAYLKKQGRAMAAGEAAQFSRSSDTDSAAFRKWFGDSKVVDADGKPLVVYRGEESAFSDIGQWFTTDIGTANAYSEQLAGGYKEGANVLPVFLAMQNPLVVDARGGQYYGFEFEGADVNTDELALEASTRGHDGLIVKNVRDGSTRPTDVYRVFRNEQIKSTTGNNGDFDPANPDIRFSRKSVNPDDYVNGQKIDRSQDDLNFGPRQSFAVPEPGVLDNVVRAMQNNKIDLKRVQDAIREAGGRISEREDAYLNEELYIGKVADMVDKFVDNRVTPLLEAVQKAGLTLEEVNLYLYARHAPERNAQLRKINPGRINNGALSGMSDKRSAEVMSEFAKDGKDTKLASIATMVDNITQESRRRIVTNGLEAAEVVSAWEAVYKNYVPLMADVEVGPRRGKGGFNVKGPESQRAMGQINEAQNILANVIAQTQSVIIRAEKAKVGRSLLDLARQFPSDNFWKVDQPPKKRHVNPDTGLVEWVEDPLFKNRENVLVVKENGVEHYIVFNERNERAMQIAAAMQNLDVPKLPWVIEASGKLTRYLAQWITARNPLFWITNFTRDVQGAAFNLQNTPIAGKEAAVLKSIPAAMKGYWKITRGDGTGKWADYAREFKSAGSETGFIKVFDTPEDHMADLEKQFEQMQQGAADPRRLARALIEAIDDYNTIVENGVRLAVYQTARENGETIRKAASLAKNITVNFNRKGNQSTGFNALYMFMNASIQGNVRFLTAIKDSRRAQIVASTLVGMGFVLDAVNRAIGGDDDETGRAKYDQIPEFEKERNWIFMTPSGKYIKIPMPYGPHIAINIGRMTSEMIFRPKVDPIEKALALARITVDAFNPLGATGSFTQLLMPSLVKPVAQVAENKSFTGGPVYREGDERGYIGPAYTRHFRSTPAHWVGASKLLSDVTGGDDIKPGAVDVPAEVLRTLFISYAVPGMMQTIDRSIDTSTRASQGKKIEPSQVPALSRFYGEAPEERAQERAYYDEQRKINQSIEQINRYAKTGNRAGMERALADLGDGDARKGREIKAKWDAAETGLLELNKKRKQLETDRIDDAKQKAQLDRIEENRMKLIRRVLR